MYALDNTDWEWEVLEWQSLDDDMLGENLKRSGLQEQQVLFWGKAGEQIMNAKADVAQLVAVVVALLLGFSIEKLVDLDESSFQHSHLFKCYATCLVISTSCGFSSLLILTFTSAKLKRLVARSLLYIGDQVGDEGAQHLGSEGTASEPKDVGTDYNGSRYGLFMRNAVKGRIWCESNGIRYNMVLFWARQWYGAHSPAWITPKNLTKLALLEFAAMCVAFVAALCFKLLDMFSGSFMTGILAMFLAVPVVGTFIVLGHLEALHDLA